jgi:hypothetical protein
MLVLAAALYYVEKNNKFAKKYQEKEVYSTDSFTTRMSKLWLKSKEPLEKASTMLFGVFWSMAVTFIVFPGVICAANFNLFSSDAWYSLFIVTIFNLFDTLGRYIGGLEKLQIRSNTIINGLGFFRLVFVGISVMFMVLQNQQAVVLITNLALLAVTNGYLQSVCCCHAPALVSEREQETLGNLIVIMITLGCSVGGLA